MLKLRSRQECWQPQCNDRCKEKETKHKCKNRSKQGCPQHGIKQGHRWTGNQHRCKHKCKHTQKQCKRKNRSSKGAMHTSSNAGVSREAPSAGLSKGASRGYNNTSTISGRSESSNTGAQGQARAGKPN